MVELADYLRRTVTETNLDRLRKEEREVWRDLLNNLSKSSCYTNNTLVLNKLTSNKRWLIPFFLHSRYSAYSYCLKRCFWIWVMFLHNRQDILTVKVGAQLFWLIWFLAISARERQKGESIRVEEKQNSSRYCLVKFCQNYIFPHFSISSIISVFLCLE